MDTGQRPAVTGGPLSVYRPTAGGYRPLCSSTTDGGPPTLQPSGCFPEAPQPPFSSAPAVLAIRSPLTPLPPLALLFSMLFTLNN